MEVFDNLLGFCNMLLHVKSHKLMNSIISVLCFANSSLTYVIPDIPIPSMSHMPMSSKQPIKVACRGSLMASIGPYVTFQSNGSSTYPRDTPPITMYSTDRQTGGLSHALLVETIIF